MVTRVLLEYCQESIAPELGTSAGSGLLVLAGD